MIEKIVFDSGIDGIKLLVLGAVHGNEIAGPNAIFKIIDDIQSYKIPLKSGRITFVPICNLKAYEKNVRQIDENLNRVMRYHENPATYEQYLANELVPVIAENDILLDLHSTHSKGDMPFVFCDYPMPENLKMIDAIGVDYVLLGWPQIYAGTEIFDYSTEQWAHDCQKGGITLECGYHQESEATDVAYEAIINVMKQYDMIEGQALQGHLKTAIRLTEYIGSIL